MDAYFTKDLSFIDCAIASLEDFEVEEDIISLNFHCNKIQRICNLERYTCLRHLDLSSNQISVIESLDWLTSLRSVNLSNNRITHVPFMRNLIHLSRFDLSYNLVEDASGLSVLKGLQTLLLQGNKLNDISKFLKWCSNLSKLTHLVVQESDTSTNPMCGPDLVECENTIWESLPNLISLNFCDKFGHNVDINDLSPPGVEDFLEYLTSDTYPTSDDSTARKLVNRSKPSIVDSISQYANAQKRSLQGKDRQQMGDSSPPSMSSQERKRIEMLEEQLRKLMEQQNRLAEQENKTSKRVHVSSSNDTTSPRWDNLVKTETDEKKTSFVDKNKRKGTTGSSNVVKKVETQTVSSLIKELEMEKQKRWKSEETTCELKTKLMNLKSQLNQQKMVEKTLNETVQDLKEALKVEQSRVNELRQLVDDEKENSVGKRSTIEQIHNEKVHLEKELESKKDKINELENSLLSANARSAKRDQDSVRQLKALAKEYEKLQSFSKTQIDKLKNVECELEEKKELLKTRHTIDSQEVKDFVKENIEKHESVKDKEIENLNSKIAESKEQYKELEDEFRMALYSESGRYNELLQSYQNVEQNLKEYRNSYDLLKQKHEKSTKLCQELTNVVKEQKGRLVELQKVKQDLQNDLRLKCKTFDEQIEQFREKLKNHEVLKNDKVKLAAHIQAQDSIIEGLRKERKLWEEELAKQGTSLAADRGRLEVKIENLEKELRQERSLNQNEKDSLKIKSKVIEDQTDTIKKLKDAIVERENALVKTREDAVKTQKDLEEQLAEECKLRQDLQEELSLNSERKQALKEDINSFKSELQDKSVAYDDLMKKWKQKSALIGQLEVQVKEMKSNWDQKEAALVKERDRAIHAAETAVEKLKSIEDKFGNELKETKEKYESERMELLSSCEARIEEVESEMRQMLKEHEKYKKDMDRKFNRLHSAISDFQTNDN